MMKWWCVFVSWIVSWGCIIAQTQGFQCTRVTDDIRLITYISGDEKFAFQASDVALLKGEGACMGCEITDDKIRMAGLNLLIQAPIEKNGFQIFLAQGEKIYGGGERATSFNRRGQAFALNNNPWYGYGYGADHLNYSVPFFISSRGYGLFFDNPSRGKVDIGKSHLHIFDVQFTGGALHMYVIEGGSTEEILRNYHELTGRQEMVPKWAMGLFMSRFGYQNENQVFEIAKEMDAKKIPFDAVIFDLFWFGDSIKSTMGNLEWVNKKAWPDPKKMISKLAGKKRKSILITEPFVLETAKNYQESQPYLSKNQSGEAYILQDFYFGKGGLIDIFRPDARQWFLSKYEAQIKNGVAGWWGDLGEPEKHPDDLYHDLSSMDGSNAVPSTFVHNLYGHAWTKMLYEYYKINNPQYRLFNLNRAGFAGTQRYGIIPWTGDVSRSWDGFRAQIPLLTGMALSGIPYIHSDAGGFAGGEKDAELYARWFQFSVFTPILRPHGTAVYDVDPGAISFPSEPALIDGGWSNTIQSYARLRYEMMPYNYHLAYRHFQFGDPLITPMFYHFPEDEECKHLEDQYMWGKDIIVAPVLEKGQKVRKFYLPTEFLWYTLQAKNMGKPLQKHTGWQETKTEDQSMPVYVKEGSFIVLNVLKEGKTMFDFDNGNAEIHYYFSDQNSSGEWFDDDGENRLSINNGLYDLFSFTMEHESDKSMCTISYKHGCKTKWREKREAFIFFHGLPAGKKVYMAGKEIKMSNLNAIKVNLRRGSNIEVVIQ